jgi:hypothetical protein
MKVKNSILELLIIFECILARTKFDSIQIGIEIVLIFYFLFSCFNKVLNNKYYSFFLITFFFFSLVGLYTSKLDVFALNTKIYLLAFLSIVYFKTKKFEFFFLKYFMWANIFLILYQVVFKIYLLADFIDAYGSTFNSSYIRPIGLFLSPHESMNILAIYLLYKIYKGGGIFLRLMMIYFGEVTFILASFIFQLFFYKISIFLDFFKHLKMALKSSKKFIFILFIILFLFFFLFINIFPDFKFSIIEYDWNFLNFLLDPGRIFGIQVVLSQFLDYKTYLQIFTLFPRDFNSIQDGFWHFAGNEIMYFQLIQQGGFIVFILYMYLLLMSSGFFKVFILTSLFHYGDVITPLVISMFITFSNEIQFLNNEKT